MRGEMEAESEGGRGEITGCCFCRSYSKPQDFPVISKGRRIQWRSAKREGRACYTCSNKNTDCVHVWVYVWTLHSQFLKCWTLSCPEKLPNCHSKTALCRRVVRTHYYNEAPWSFKRKYSLIFKMESGSTQVRVAGQEALLETS